jgi:hypothetical protein
MADMITIEEARETAAGRDAIAEAIGIPFDEWGHRCHEISLKVLRASWPGEGRIARGWCRGVPSQHSWITLGDDCYDPAAIIVDPVLWSYQDDVKGIYAGRLGASAYGHRPHGSGDIWRDGSPPENETDPAKIIGLTPSVPLSPVASAFLSAVIGPLGYKGWMQLAALPAGGGWPAGEIIAAIDDTEALRAVVPVDILGMVTDRNPGGLYR